MNKNMKKQRPVNLDLKTIKFPIAAIASILQRVSGVMNIFFMALILRLLEISLSSPEGFLKIRILMNHILFKMIMWLVSTIMIFHIIGGIRHILMDIGFFIKNEQYGARSAQIVFIFTTILSIITGVFIW
ncbi:MAG: succinate dehydrogenase, cytochrome b556 subunit [Candidatus Dasytiphilus stammeri]